MTSLFHKWIAKSWKRSSLCAGQTHTNSEHCRVNYTWVWHTISYVAGWKMAHGSIDTLQVD
ncbi:MAG: hypothetical protein IPF63_09200 [Bacteroidetes bacterium]|nr:hypothetical protein [Bacteroidota bacterium]